MSTPRRLFLALLTGIAMELGLREPALAQKISIYESKPVTIGARSMGFADATVGDIHDVSIMYENPAALVFLQNHSIIFSHSEELSIHAMNENVSIPFSLGNRQSLGLGVSVQHVGYVGQSKGDVYKAIEYGYDLAYANEIFRSMSVGGVLNVRYGNTDQSNIVAVSGIVGISYSPLPSSSYGVVLKDIGDGIIYSSDQVSTSLSRGRLPGSLEAGLTLRNPTMFEPVGFTASLSSEKVFQSEGVTFRGGIELLVFTYARFRVGYMFDDAAEVGSTRYGVGFQYEGFSFDLGYTPHWWSEEYYRLSLAVVVR